MESSESEQRLEANAGPLTNFEVFEFLRSKGAGKDPTPLMLSNNTSEYKVFKYLEKSGCKNLTIEVIKEFVGECKSFKISKAEILNIINIMPTSLPELYPMLEAYDARFNDEEDETLNKLLETIERVLLASSLQPGNEKIEEEIVEETEAAPEENGVEATE